MLSILLDSCVSELCSHTHAHGHMCHCPLSKENECRQKRTQTGATFRMVFPRLVGILRTERFIYRISVQRDALHIYYVLS